MVAHPTVLGASTGEVDAPFPGVSRSTHQSRQATVTAYTFQPGASFPRHVHPEEQITVILEGQVEMTVGDQPIALGPGETYAVAGGIEHGLRAGPAGARFLAVVVPRRARPDAYEIKGDPRSP